MQVDIEVTEVRMFSNRFVVIAVLIQVILWTSFYFVSGGYTKDFGPKPTPIRLSLSDTATQARPTLLCLPI